MVIRTKEEFNAFVERFWQNKAKPEYWGIARAYADSEGKAIAYKILTLNCKENYGALAAVLDGLDRGLALGQIENEYFSWLDRGFHTNVEALSVKDVDVFVTYETELGIEPQSLLDVHIRLAILSRRIKKPNEINLDEAFKLLPNLVWTNVRPFTIEDWNKKFVKCETEGITVLAVDKFPPFFLWNPVPSGVRVANADMIRAGAHLAEGTTVMHYGFVNFNAGTLGPSMVEGRISAGTVIDGGTDIGAGGGFLGTLSGGNSIKMKAGKKCLVGAMAEVGVPLGDNCTVATGPWCAPGTPIYGLDEKCWKKAIDLRDQDNLLIWRNSKNGRIEVQRKKVEVTLNEELHKNN